MTTNVELPQIHRGDDWDFIGTFTLAGGSLVGCTLWMTLKTSLDQADGAAAILISTATSGVTILSATTVEFVLTAAQTAALSAGRYYVDIQAKTQTGKIITCQNLERSTVVVADVTRAIT